MSSYDLRLPMINGTDDKTKIMQIQSFLYQHVQQLNWVIGAITGEIPTDNTSVSTQVHITPTQAEAMFSALRPMISESVEISDAFYEMMSSRMEDMYADKKETEDTLKAIRKDIESINKKLKTISGQIDSIKVVANDEYINALIDARLGV